MYTKACSSFLAPKIIIEVYSPFIDKRQYIITTVAETMAFLCCNI